MNSAADRETPPITPRRMIGLIDLTNLDDDCTDADVETLCEDAIAHRVAGVCVWPDFVALAARLLGSAIGSGPRDADRIDVVSVVNFPTGDERPVAIEAVTERCLADGASEIDVVLPYRRFLAGDTKWCETVLSTVRRATEPVDSGWRAAMKVILETGELSDPDAIRRAAKLAIGCGADFVKTSTGKSSVSATPEAVATIADEIASAGADIGIKPSGGIRSIEQATEYIDIVDSRLGSGWARPETFRFGASGLLKALLTAEKLA